MISQPAPVAKPAAIAPCRPELQLLLGCLHPQPNVANNPHLQTLHNNSINWECLLKLAGWHGVLPLLYKALRPATLELVPAPVLNKLQAYYHSNAMHNTVLHQNMVRILELLTTNGVEVVPYKGPALALRLYGDVALRCCTDLDILVRPQDVLKSQALLLANGYKPEPDLNVAQEKLYLQCNNVLHFFRPDDYIMLELHWAITPGYLATAFNVVNLWPRLERMPLEGVDVKQPQPDDLLLLLCVHGSKHCWESLKWLADVAWLVYTYPELNWERLLVRAKETGNRHSLWLGLRLANELLTTDLPPAILAEIQTDPTVTRLSQRTQRQLAWLPGQKINAFQRASYRVQLMDNMARRLKYGFGFLFSPDALDFTYFNLPASLTFCYRPLRLVRLLGKYGISCLHL